LVALAEPIVFGNAGAPSGAVLVAMLDAALAEYPPERVVVLASDRVRPRLGTALAAAAARGACIVSSEIAPLPAVDGAAEVYSAGGEIGFLALLADRAVKAFAASFYTGWGLTAGAAGIPAQRRRCRRRRAARLRSRAARHRCLGVTHPTGSAGIGGPRRCAADSGRGRVCPLGRARRRFSAAGLARLR